MSYLVWKLLHVLSVILFLGNIITGAFWASRAHNSGSFKEISLTFQSIIKADRYFTVPGVLGITVAGIASAISANIPMLSTGWIFWAIVLFIISGIIFSVYVGPLQRKIVDITSRDNSKVDWDTYDKYYKQGAICGILSVVTPLLAVVIMVIKPDLPGL